jgi:hypothetical protein
MKIHLIYGYYQVGINAWWEWFSATVINVGPIECIAVKNSSQNNLKPLRMYPKIFPLI